MMIDEIDKIIRKYKDIPLEFFGSTQKTAVSETHADKLCSANSSVNGGIGVKAIVEGRAGFSYATDMSLIEKAVIQAMANARFSELEQKTLPEKRDMQTIKNIYDKKVSEMTLESVMDISGKLSGDLKAVNKDLKMNLSIVEAASSNYFLVNSNGASYSSELTSISAVCEAVFKNSSGNASFVATSLKKFNTDFLVGKASRLAVNSVGKKNVKSACQTVVLDADVIDAIFGNTLYLSVNADRVQKGQSMLAGRIGEVIGSECLDIRDCGALDMGLCSSPFDRDGIPSRKTDIISGGVLKSFLYDHVTALREDRDSTGNGAGNFNTMSSVSPTNVVIEPSRTGFDSMISGIKDGMIIYEAMGAHTANPITGDFSLAIANGFKIIDGEIAYPVKNAMFVGNIFDLLKSVSGLASDVRQTGHLVSPTISFDRQKIVG
ncbi:MAG: metallopeptidase TldD-related protein [archaeon]|nr:metallopeptidase TldD-related protein [archaeon]